MNWNYSLLLPEFIATGMLALFILKEVFIPASKKVTGFAFELGGLLIVLISLIGFLNKEQAAFGGMFLVDPLSTFFKIFFTLTAAVVILMAHQFFHPSLYPLPKGERGTVKFSLAPAGGEGRGEGEFFLILWTALIGLFFLVSANDFLLLFIALEILTISSYIMTAYLRQNSASIEAGIKYLILGSLASAFIIYGISLLYVGCGSTSLITIRQSFSSGAATPLMKLGLLLVLSGLGFKVAAVPFHLWVPDVYEGSPTPVGGFLAVASKSAGFAVLLRLLFTVFIPLEKERALLFSALPVMAMLYGNLGALVQTNIKRLFGYSSIGHAGYLLIGLAAGKEMGTQALIYYLIAYAFSNLAAWFVINQVESVTSSNRIDAYRGLAKRSPLLAGIFFLALLSLAGVPPLAGFSGKFLILLAAVQAHLNGVALIGSLGVAVSLYYYLMIVRMMYIEESNNETSILLSPSSKILLSVLAAGILFVGIWQAPFLQAAQHAAASLF